MTTPTRVTLRCVQDDLTDDWDDASDLRIVQSGNAGSTKAVYLLQHKLIQKAVGDFPTTGDVEKRRESISGLTDPPFWKVKTERWRGAVYVDPKDGQAWLVAAGRRYGDELKDFYKHFMAEVENRGAEHFLPTKDDDALLRKEVSDRELESHDEHLLRKLEARENYLKSVAVSLLANALHSSDHYADQEVVLDQAAEEPQVLFRIGLIVDLPDPGQPDPFSVLIEIKDIEWSFHPIIAWDEQVMLAALCPKEDRWGTTQTDVRMHSVDVSSREELDAMASGEVARNPLGHFDPGEYSHNVHRARLAQATVEGEPVLGICGRWFVPRQDHEQKPRCETCATLLSFLEKRSPEAREHN